MLSLLPFSTQIEFSDEQGNLFWMSVKPDDLTIDSGNLTLKYGPRIRVIGMLLALSMLTLKKRSRPQNFLMVFQQMN
jgi:hypothetical protein